MKYPRTYHLPWSDAITADDKRLTEEELSYLKSVPLVYTEKMDGENTNFSRDYIHARSADKKYRRPWQTWMRSWWEGILYQLPDHLQFCGECMYAKHSIEYPELSAYFYLFSVFDLENDIVLPWKEVEFWANELKILTVPKLLQAATLGHIFQDSCKLQDSCNIISKKSWYGQDAEGYVVRNADSFLLKDFKYNVAKYVRKDHVQTDKTWTKTWTKNKLKRTI